MRDIRKSAATQEDEKVVSPGSALSAVSSETLTYKDKVRLMHNFFFLYINQELIFCCLLLANIIAETGFIFV